MVPMEISNTMGWIIVVALNLALTGVFIFVRSQTRRR